MITADVALEALSVLASGLLLLAAIGGLLTIGLGLTVAWLITPWRYFFLGPSRRQRREGEA